MIYQKQHLLSRQSIDHNYAADFSLIFRGLPHAVPLPMRVLTWSVTWSQASLANIKFRWLIHSQFHFLVNSTWKIHSSSAVCFSRTLAVDKNRILCQKEISHCYVRCNSSFDGKQMMLAALMLSRKSMLVVPCRVCMNSVIVELYFWYNRIHVHSILNNYCYQVYKLHFRSTHVCSSPRQFPLCTPLSKITKLHTLVNGTNCSQEPSEHLLVPTRTCLFFIEEPKLPIS